MCLYKCLNKNFAILSRKHAKRTCIINGRIRYGLDPHMSANYASFVFDMLPEATTS